MGAVFFYTKSTYTAKVEYTPTGACFKSFAKLGVIATSDWVVEALPMTDGMEHSKITENSSVTVSALLAPMVRYQWSVMHDEIPNYIRKALEARVSSSKTS